MKTVRKKEIIFEEVIPETKEEQEEIEKLIRDVKNEKIDLEKLVEIGPEDREEDFFK